MMQEFLVPPVLGSPSPTFPRPTKTGPAPQNHRTLREEEKLQGSLGEAGPGSSGGGQHLPQHQGSPIGSVHAACNY